jgi:hypothetical protein
LGGICDLVGNRFGYLFQLWTKTLEVESET